MSEYELHIIYALVALHADAETCHSTTFELIAFPSLSLSVRNNKHTYIHAVLHVISMQNFFLTYKYQPTLHFTLHSQQTHPINIHTYSCSKKKHTHIANGEQALPSLRNSRLLLLLTHQRLHLPHGRRVRRR